jgi:hypothetical protein
MKYRVYMTARWQVQFVCHNPHALNDLIHPKEPKNRAFAKIVAPQMFECMAGGADKLDHLPENYARSNAG